MEQEELEEEEGHPPHPTPFQGICPQSSPQDWPPAPLIFPSMWPVDSTVSQMLPDGSQRPPPPKPRLLFPEAHWGARPHPSYQAAFVFSRQPLAITFQLPWPWTDMEVPSPVIWGGGGLLQFTKP